MKHAQWSARASAPATPDAFPWSRRRFLRLAALGAAAPMILPSGLLSAAPNSKLCHACVGTAGMGVGDMNEMMKHPRVQIVALCDVDASHLGAAAQKAPDARKYRDWRELLATEGDKIDSLNVTVPDHMHFPIAFSAVKRRKHVYVQKPMCHDVAEVRALTKEAARRKVVTQLGTQLASGLGDMTTVQLLRQGAIGQIKHVYLTANRPGAVEHYRLPGPRPPQGEPPPAHLNWDHWLGTAPARPYAPGIYHPVKWRAWLDFGTGWSGDIGCHVFDAVWKGLGLKTPKSVYARVQESWRDSPARRADTWPQANHITWVFPGNTLTADKELIVEWFDGEFYPPREIMAMYSVKDYPPESMMLIGTEGSLLMELGRGPMLLPDAKFRDFKKPAVPRRNHYHHFVDACLGGEPTESGFEHAGPMTEAILLGTVAVQVPETELKWSFGAQRFTNNPQANLLLKRKYRAGWEVS